MFSPRPSRGPAVPVMARDNIGSPTELPALAAVDQPLSMQASPTRGPHGGEIIPVQNWNSLQSGQVHYPDAAAGAWYDRERSSAVCFSFTTKARGYVAYVFYFLKDSKQFQQSLLVKV